MQLAVEFPRSFLKHSCIYRRQWDSFSYAPRYICHKKKCLSSSTGSLILCPFCSELYFSNLCRVNSQTISIGPIRHLYLCALHLVCNSFKKSTTYRPYHIRKRGRLLFVDRILLVFYLSPGAMAAVRELPLQCTSVDSLPDRTLCQARIENRLY